MAGLCSTLDLKMGSYLLPRRGVYFNVPKQLNRVVTAAELAPEAANA
jgi:hypothetical protein